jgi:hypothetical protein
MHKRPYLQFLPFGFIQVFAYVNTTLDRSFVSVPKMNTKVFCGTTNTISLLEKWTRSAAPPVTRDPLSLYGTLLKRGKMSVELAPEMPSRTPPPRQTVVTSKSVNYFC